MASAQRQHESNIVTDGISPHTCAVLYVLSSAGLAGVLSLGASWQAGVIFLIVWSLLGATLISAYAVDRYVFPILEHSSTTARQWLQRRDDYVSRMARSVLDRIGPEPPLVAVLAAAVMGGTWLFLGVLEDVVSGDPLVAVDKSVFRFLQELRTPIADTVLVAVTELGDRTVIITAVIVASMCLLVLRLWQAAVFLVLAAFGSTVFVYGMKWVVHRPRPIALYDGVSEFSFPSGHATSSIVVYGFLAILLGRSASPALRRALITSALALNLLIAFSRLYLGAHWFSDVAAGLSFGIAWIAGLAIAYFRHERRALPAPLLSGALALAVLGAGVWHVSRTHATDMVRYAPHAAIPSRAVQPQ